MVYLIVFIALLVAELIYFRIANRFNIIDKPNQRSSHNIIVLRGGGIIFTISLFVYFLTQHFNYPWFMFGLTIIASISFADDVKPQSSLLRVVLQMAAIIFLLYQLYVLNLLQYQFYIIIITFLLIVFFVNTYNFMDGINGITTANSFTVLAALFYLNNQIKLFDNNAIIYLVIGNLVFFMFNFRVKAKCFSGDVGSIGMAFALLFFMAGFIFKTGAPIFILLFAIYAIDAGMTIFYRLLKKENIFKAHRQHLYQYLANEKQWPQLMVSIVYMLLQAIISLLVCMFWQKGLVFQYFFVASILVGLAIIYSLVKRSILQNG